MKTIKSHVLMGALLLASATASFAQDSKIGYVNTQRIIVESVPGKAGQGKLEQEFSKRNQDLIDMAGSLKSMQTKLERDGPTMTDSQRATRQKEFAELNRDFQRKQRELQEDLNSRRNEELQQLMDKASKAVKQVAETEKFDLILQVDGPGIVAYTNNKLDTTDKVLKILNAGK